MISSLLYQVKDGLDAIYNDLNRYYLNIYYPSKPKTINLLVNDICNSRCQMCLIWQNDKKYEFSIEEFEVILKNPLFSKVEHVGITGGEPTLRKDLSKIVEKVVLFLPSLKGISMITNAIKPKKVIDQIIAIHEITQKSNHSFSVMVSLDGVDDVHDKIRGRNGNFLSAEQVINYLKNENIPVSTGTTIVKDNVWHIDELLEYLQENSLYGRFRVAEFIDRLYNSQQKEYIRNFSSDEIYHLQLFFHRVLSNFEKSDKIKRTYANIIHMLGGGNRIMACPYQTSGVVFSSMAQLSYCAPKSPELGHMLNKSAEEIYKKNIHKRRDIIKKHCSSCIHDYHASKTSFQKKVEIEEKVMKRILHSHNSMRRTLSKLLKPLSTVNNIKVLITGWYGTETVGDKAILKTIIEDYLNIYTQEQIAVTSLYPFVTINTLNELNYQLISVINVYSLDFIVASRNCKVVIMGGGPLMGIKALNVPILAFETAINAKKIVYGCGIGPLERNSEFEEKVRHLLSISDEVSLRDEESQKIANSWGIKSNLVSDPAVQTIRKLKKDYTEKSPVLACFLRDWPESYATKIDRNEYVSTKKRFEKSLANWIKMRCEKLGLIPAFFPMHTFHVGGDDRVFARRFVKEHFQSWEVIVNDKPSTIESIARQMQQSQECLTMRFHSTVFARNLEVEFTAIDYTMGGKVYAYLKAENLLSKLVTIEDIIDY